MSSWSSRGKFFRCLSLVFVVSISFVLSAAAIGIDEPSLPPFSGGYFVTGYDSSLGEVTLYFSESEGWCLDDDGYLFRCSSSSTTGIMFLNGSQYSVTVSAWDYPRYRSSDSNYSYTYIYSFVSDSNILIQTEFAPVYSFSNSLDLILLFSVGLIAIILLTRRSL